MPSIQTIQPRHRALEANGLGPGSRLPLPRPGRGDTKANRIDDDHGRE